VGQTGTHKEGDWKDSLFPRGRCALRTPLEMGFECGLRILCVASRTRCILAGHQSEALDSIQIAGVSPDVALKMACNAFFSTPCSMLRAMIYI
jgi:hypothetical protein